MGWQSYIIGYKTDEELTQIMRTILNHNNERDDSIVGEELVQVMTASFKPYKRAWNITDTNVVLFGNQGGRGSTFEYFENKGFKIRPYDSCMSRRMSNWNEELIPSRNYMFLNMQDKEISDLVDLSNSSQTEDHIHEYLWNNHMLTRSFSWRINEELDYKRLEVYDIDWTGFWDVKNIK